MATTKPPHVTERSGAGGGMVMGDDDLVKVSMNLPPDDVKTIDEIARRRHITKTDVVRRGINAERFLEELKAENAKLVVHRPDGSVERVVFPW
jgi:hypothetical protein